MEQPVVKRGKVDDARAFLDAAIDSYIGKEAIAECGLTVHAVREVTDDRAPEVAAKVREALRRKHPRLF